MRSTHPVRTNLWYDTDMQGQRDRLSGHGIRPRHGIPLYAFRTQKRSRACNRPNAADEALSLALQAFDLRPPIERPNPSFSIAMRNQASPFL